MDVGEAQPTSLFGQWLQQRARETGLVRLNLPNEAQRL